MNLKTVNEVESKVCPGVVYCIRTLNLIQRAKRDFEISEHRFEHGRLESEKLALLQQHGIAGTAEERLEKLQALPAADARKLFELSDRADKILTQYVAPAEIRAALISVTGLEINGEPVSVESFIEHATDDLLVECREHCIAAAGLSGEEQKNSQ